MLKKNSELETAIKRIIFAQNKFKKEKEFHPGVLRLLWDDVHYLLGIEHRPYIGNNKLYERKESNEAIQIYNEIVEGKN